MNPEEYEKLAAIVSPEPYCNTSSALNAGIVVVITVVSVATLASPVAVRKRDRRPRPIIKPELAPTVQTRHIVEPRRDTCIMAKTDASSPTAR